MMRSTEIQQRLGCTDAWLFRYAELVGSDHPGSGNHREWTEDQFLMLEKIHDLMEIFDRVTQFNRTTKRRSQAIRYQVPKKLLAEWVEPGPWVETHGNHRITVTVERIDDGINQ